MRFGLKKGNFVNMMKKEVLPDGGLAFAGGAAGGLAFGLIQNTKFFSELMTKDEADPEKKATKDMAKKLVLAVLLGAGGGSALWMAGKPGVNAAKGLMGAMGATAAAVIWNHFAKEEAKRVNLQGTRVYQGELPSGIAGQLGNVNVRGARERSPYGNQQLMTVLAG